MEIKITADKKLLDAIDKLAEALKASVQPATDALTAAAAEAEEVDTQNVEPASEAQEAAQDEPAKEPEQEAQAAPTREEIQRIAVAKIQAKLGKQVKALIEKHGGTRVSDVPETNLAAFKADLEQL